MDWYIGQPIVAIKDHSQGDFKKGDEFTILGIHESFCTCKHILLDIGNRFDLRCQYVICKRCFLKYSRTSDVLWYNEVCFAPLDGNIDELIETLHQPIKETSFKLY